MKPKRKTFDCSRRISAFGPAGLLQPSPTARVFLPFPYNKIRAQAFWAPDRYRPNETGDTLKAVSLQAAPLLKNRAATAPVPHKPNRSGKTGKPVLNGGIAQSGSNGSAPKQGALKAN